MSSTIRVIQLSRSNGTTASERKSSQPTVVDIVAALAAINNAGNTPDADLCIGNSKRIVTRLDVYFLGITIGIGGQFVGWNAGLDTGLSAFFICFLLISVAYITLCCCAAEVSGILPFAGGAYRLTRCTLGLFPGFLIGCCESLKYITYVSASMIKFTQLLTQGMIPSWDGYEPVLWAVLYGVVLLVHLQGGRLFWNVNAALAVVSLLVVLVYCVGSLPFTDFDRMANRQNQTDFRHGFPGFMKSFSYAIWFYVGIEALNLANDQVHNPKQVIPLAQLACVATLFGSGLFVFFVSVALPPGLATLSSVLAPFNRGFEPLLHASEQVATILTLPAVFATAFGFMWCYGKLIFSMARSSSLPKWLASPSLATVHATKTTKIGVEQPAPSSSSSSSSSINTATCKCPYQNALLVGSVMSYALCFLHFAVGSLGERIFNFCAMCAFLGYIAQCVGYIALRTNYRSITSSTFKSPFEMAGALISLSIWVPNLIAAGCFHGHYEFIDLIAVLLLLSGYYWMYARHHQVLSQDETRLAMIARIKHSNKSNTAKTIAQ